MTRELRLGFLVEEGWRESEDIWRSGRKKRSAKLLLKRKRADSGVGLSLPMLVGSGISQSLRAATCRSSHTQHVPALMSSLLTKAPSDGKVLSCFPHSFF